ncbi:MAG: disulfide bond formation protein DsbA [Alphaproteobacteria bacterium]|nr:disulfide bond formation protein DsbA [Alphaproteobacteria bacterium]
MSLPVVQHYSDVLCVWAYAAHIRLDEMAKRYGQQVRISVHFCPVFPDARGKITAGWAKRGGFAAYGDHVAEVGAQFDHVNIHADVWRKTRPQSSNAAHLFLKAVELAQDPATSLRESDAYRATWAMRQAFFEETRDIGDARVQREVAQTLGLDLAAIEAQLQTGAAMAALDADTKFCEVNKISGSPTIRMNGGRQILYGNVGFHLIEANLKELLRAPNPDEASWC